MSEERLARVEKMTENIRNALGSMNSDREENSQYESRGNTLSEQIESLEKMIQSIVQMIGKRTTDGVQSVEGNNRTMQVRARRTWTDVTRTMMNDLNSNFTEFYDIKLDEKEK